MSFIFDPRFFNALIIFMFLTAAVRWACAGNWLQVVYWVSGAALNAVVTMMPCK